MGRILQLLAILLWICAMLALEDLSFHPTVHPTSAPISMIIHPPTLAPKISPVHPTGQPTMSPSNQPSSQPSQQPSGQPSAQPSGQPTDRPTTASPTGQPTSQPTARPTVQPSGRPTVRPSTQPSVRPSSHPTDQRTTRQLECNKPNNCESNINGTCTFFTESILIVCKPYTTLCYFSGKNVNIRDGAHLKVSGLCSLTLAATDGSFYMHKNSWIAASAVHINATKDVTISGVVDVTGRTSASPVDPPTNSPTPRPTFPRSHSHRALSGLEPSSSLVSRWKPRALIAPSITLTSYPTRAATPRTTSDVNKDVINTRTAKPTSQPLALLPRKGLGVPEASDRGGSYGGSGGRGPTSSGVDINIIFRAPSMHPALNPSVSPTIKTAARPSNSPTPPPSSHPTLAPTQANQKSCIGELFTNTEEQVGEVFLQRQIASLAPDDLVTATGSDGGGGEGAGKGGGRIVIFAVGSFNLTFDGQLLADGGMPELPIVAPTFPTPSPTTQPSSFRNTSSNSTHYPSAQPTASAKPTTTLPMGTSKSYLFPNKGSGSGGAIALTATQFIGSGYLSAKGGDGTVLGGAGGGGRISIQILSVQQDLGYLVRVHGGLAVHPPPASRAPTSHPTMNPTPHTNNSSNSTATTHILPPSNTMWAPEPRGAGGVNWYNPKHPLGAGARRGLHEVDFVAIQSAGALCATGGAGTLFIQYGVAKTSSPAGYTPVQSREIRVEEDLSSSYVSRDRSLAESQTQRDIKKPVIPNKSPPPSPPRPEIIFPPGVLYISNHGFPTAAATIVDTTRDQSILSTTPVTAAAKLFMQNGPQLAGIVVADLSILAVGEEVSLLGRQTSPDTNCGSRMSAGVAFGLGDFFEHRTQRAGGYTNDFMCSFLEVEDATVAFFLSATSYPSPSLPPTAAPTKSPTSMPSMPTARPTFAPSSPTPSPTATRHPTVKSSFGGRSVNRRLQHVPLTSLGGTVGSVLQVDQLVLHKKSLLLTSRSTLAAAVVANNVQVRDFAVVDFSYALELSIGSRLDVNGTLTQPLSKHAALTGAGLSIIRAPSALDGAVPVNITLGNVTVSSALVVDVDNIVVHGRSFITIPPLQGGACWQTIQQSDFTCQEGTYSGALDLLQNGTVVLGGKTSVTLTQGAAVQAPLVLLCGGAVQLDAGASAAADGCGCTGNNGQGQGAQPVVEDSVVAGGSGGAYGGFGGRGGAHPSGQERTGGTAYHRTFREVVSQGASGATGSNRGAGTSAYSSIRGVSGPSDIDISSNDVGNVYQAPTRKSTVSPTTGHTGPLILHVFNSGSGGGCSGPQCGGTASLATPNESPGNNPSSKGPDGPSFGGGSSFSKSDYEYDGIYYIDGRSYPWSGPLVGLSAGGGIVVLQADVTTTVNGVVSSNGAPGGSYITGACTVGNGGGSGGLVVINAVSMTGNGTLQALGGNGGHANYVGGGGGGGGGGLVGFFNPSATYSNSFSESLFNFTGDVLLYGGASGQGPASNFVAPSAYKLGTPTTAPTTTAEALTAPPTSSINNTGLSVSYSNSSSGSPGFASWPHCQPGFGNDYSGPMGYYSVTSLCTTCKMGRYSPGGAGLCEFCNPISTNARSYYFHNKQTAPACLCECESHYPVLVSGSSCQAGQTDVCLTNFGYFMYIAFGGVFQFSGTVIGIALFFALIIMRRRIQRVFEKEEKIVFKKVFYSKNAGRLEDYQQDREVGDIFSDRESFSRRSISTGLDRNRFSVDRGLGGGAINPMVKGLGLDRDKRPRKGKMSTHRGSMIEMLDFHKHPAYHDRESIDIKYEVDPRLKLRLNDLDLASHACRIFFMGSNHPLASRGGAWQLPLAVPATLRPLVSRSEWQRMALEVNALLSWDLCSLEVLVFFVVSIALPPFAASLLAKLRHNRTQALLAYFNSYPHTCFKLTTLQDRRNSLRIGVSPDSTMAYVDVLFDEEEHGEANVYRPLGPIGQPRLPLIFKMAGLGTYFSPWHLDTNDILLQSVYQTDVPTHFIDEEWIHFVVELNMRLKALQRVGLQHSLLALMKFLDASNKGTKLGGLVVELCTACNFDPVYAKEVQRAHTVSITAAMDASAAFRAAMVEAVRDFIAEVRNATDTTAQPLSSQTPNTHPSTFDEHSGSSDSEGRYRAPTRFAVSNPMVVSDRLSRAGKSLFSMGSATTAPLASSADAGSNAAGMTITSSIMQNAIPAQRRSIGSGLTGLSVPRRISMHTTRSPPAGSSDSQQSTPRLVEVEMAALSPIHSASKGSRASDASTPDDVSERDDSDGRHSSLAYATADISLEESLEESRGPLHLHAGQMRPDKIPHPVIPNSATATSVSQSDTADKLSSSALKETAALNSFASTRKAQETSQSPPPQIPAMYNPIFQALPIPLQQWIIVQTHVPSRIEDLDGYGDDYLRMCEGVLAGTLCLGIRVSHPRVAHATTLVGDHEYSSEEEKDEVVTVPSRSAAAVVGSSIGAILHGDSGASIITQTGSSSALAAMDSPSTHPNSLIARYGDKASQIEKYYGVVHTAEKGLRVEEGKNDTVSIGTGTTITATSSAESGQIVITISRLASTCPVPGMQTPAKLGIDDGSAAVIVPGSGYKELRLTKFSIPDSTIPPPPPLDSPMCGSIGSPLPSSPSRLVSKRLRKPLRPDDGHGILAEGSPGDAAYTGFKVTPIKTPAFKVSLSGTGRRDFSNSAAIQDGEEEEEDETSVPRRNDSDDALTTLEVAQGTESAADSNAVLIRASSSSRASGSGGQFMGSATTPHKTDDISKGKRRNHDRKAMSLQMKVRDASKYSQYNRPKLDPSLMSSSGAQCPVNIWRIACDPSASGHEKRPSGINMWNLSKPNDAGSAEWWTKIYKKAMLVISVGLAAATAAAEWTAEIVCRLSIATARAVVKVVGPRAEFLLHLTCPEWILSSYHVAIKWITSIYAQSMVLFTISARSVSSEVASIDTQGLYAFTSSDKEMLKSAATPKRPLGSATAADDQSGPNESSARDTIVGATIRSISPSSMHFTLSTSLELIANFFHTAASSYLSYALITLGLGANVVPVGGRYIRRMLRLALLVLSTMDIGLYVLLFIFGKVYFCESAVKSQGVTRCDDLAVPNLEAIMFVFPFSFALAPLFGTIAGLSSLSNAAVVRVYAGWSRLAMLNTMVALGVYTQFKTEITRETLGWIVGLLVGSRLIQCLLVDQYAAHIERMRWTRGWDGLVTSLIVTLDNQQDLIY